MGIRFEGPTIEHSKGADIISDGIDPAPSRCRARVCRSCCWAIGKPLAVIRRSRPSPRSICRAWGACCRARTVRFTAITVEEAEKLRRDQEARLARAVADFHFARPSGGIDLARLYGKT